MNKVHIDINQYSYSLPEDKIAYAPLKDRAASKMLVYRDGQIEDSQFNHFNEYLPKDTFIVLNETKVINARLFFKKDTGGIIELFCLEHALPDADITLALQQNDSVRWKCLIGGRKKWKDVQVPLQLELGNGHTLSAHWIADEPLYALIEFKWDSGQPFAEVLEIAGNIPLPPYIKRQVSEADIDRYQTVFAQHEGSIAAPTASLHLTNEILNTSLEQNHQIGKVTLHVGAGTFMPVKSADIADHSMHEEWISVDKSFLQSWIAAIENGYKTLAVGTTACRTLESLYWLGYKISLNLPIDYNGIGLGQWDAYNLPDTNMPTLLEALQAIIIHCDNNQLQKLQTKTQLLIIPGYKFKSIDILVTNFHQPHSTLLLLVAAFCGADYRKIYEHALEHNYRFLSYGDGSMLFKSK